MCNHIDYLIEKESDLLDMIRLWKQLKPDVLAFDTETTGINIAVDKPFLFQFGYKVGNTIYTYVVDVEKYSVLGTQTILAFLKLASTSKHLIGHNIKFDLHMLANLDIYYEGNNIVDTMACIRLAHDSLTPENGGPPLGLKAYAAQYVDRNARIHEHALATERSAIAKNYNVLLTLAVASCKEKPPVGYKRWTKGALEEKFKDVISTYKDLPESMQEIYLKWYNEIPERIRANMKTAFVEPNDVPYDLLTRESVITYGHLDIVYTLGVYYKTMDVIKARQQEEAFKIEMDILQPLFRMERTGFQINKDYIAESQKRMRDYIQRRRADLVSLVGYSVGVNQHPTIRKILTETYHLEIKTTGSEELDQIVSHLKHSNDNPDAVSFIEIIQELRTLEKWYTTYLLRFINEMRRADRIYTQIHQVGTVSGRVTSDFQQFPKYGIVDVDGEELFNPRKMVVTPISEGYVGLGYLDYSQIELRLQAFYTILVNHADLNLCRAYMPFQCHTEHNESFDYKNQRHIEMAYNWKWYKNEDNVEWTPTDVHAATTSVAFPEVDVHSDEFKKLRGKVGKRVNFAKNYGAQFNRIKQMFPNYDDETIHRIDDAYYKAFPGVKAYHSYCYELANQSAYATNLFGVRYYGLTGHKLINCLVQGSGAYFLKLKMIAVSDYLKANNYKTKFQMNIHDEMSFEVYKGEEHVLFEIKKIMEDFPGTFVPIVAEMEISKTTWANKEEVRDLEDVKRILYTETEITQ